MDITMDDCTLENHSQEEADNIMLGTAKLPLRQITVRLLRVGGIFQGAVHREEIIQGATWWGAIFQGEILLARHQRKYNEIKMVSMSFFVFRVIFCILFT